MFSKYSRPRTTGYDLSISHRGSPHVHGVAWLEDAPDVDKVLSSAILPQYIDRTITTMNPAVLPDGSNVSDAPSLPKTNPHVCNKPYCEVEDHYQDLNDTCQRHTHCSAAYCLRTHDGVQSCRFGYPKNIQPETVIVTREENKPEVITARNDGLINSHNPVQLSAWRGNVDMQYCVSKRKVIEYITKYATKRKPRSQTMKEVYNSIVRSLRDDSSSLKVVQKQLQCHLFTTVLAISYYIIIYMQAHCKLLILTQH